MGTEIMKHIAITEMPQALESIYNELKQSDCQIPLDDAVSWTKEVKDSVTAGEFQIFKCKEHYVLVEHGLYPMKNTPIVFVHNPQCEDCRKAGETIARMREVKYLGIVEYKQNQTIITTEELY